MARFGLLIGDCGLLIKDLEMATKRSFAKHQPALFGRAYYKRILSTQRAGILGYWPLWEAAGTTANDLIGGFHGTYVNAVLGQPGKGDGKTSVYFNGTNAYCKIASVPLAAAFTPALGSIQAWFKPDTGARADGSTRCMAAIGEDNNNYVGLIKASTANQFQAFYKAGGVWKGAAFTILDDLWHILTLTWNVAADRVRVYLDGVQQGEDQTGLGPYAGDISSNNTGIGNLGSAGVAIWPWKGWVQHPVIWTVELSQPEIARLAV
jgi:hypothetical protein